MKIGIKHFNLRTMHKGLNLFLIFFITTISYAQILPKTYIAYHTTESIIIDGVPSEEAWKKVKSTDLFIDIEGNKIPKYNTSVKILWDDTHVYFFAEMEEPHVWGNLKQKDTIIFHNNDFEIFIDPDNDTHNYYEFEVNPLNTLWDLFITKPYREGTPVLNDWDANGFTSSVKVHGTLNNPNDTDKGWSIEIAIPFDVFKTSYFHENVPKDKFWRVNFSRVHWDFQLQNNKYYRKKNDKGKIEHEYNWVWSPIGVINMHRPEDWGYVYFSSKEVGEKDIFKIPDDEKIKKTLYHLYRKQKEFYKKNKRWATNFLELSDDVSEIKEKKIIRTIENHQTGFNITVICPFTKRLFIIREDGKIIQKLD